MPRHKVFVSYSHTDKSVRDELVPVLRAVPSIDEILWFDEQDIDIGDEFHPQIRQALAASSIGILLLSNHFFTSNYIRHHELPYLLQYAKERALKIAPLYVTTIPDGAFKVTIEVGGQQQPINLKDYLGAHSLNEPLNTLDRGQRDKIYTRLANWVAQQLAVTTDVVPRRTGPRFELAITLRARRDHWEHRFSIPHAADFMRPKLDSTTPEMLFSYPAYTVDGEDLFQVLFGSDVQMSGAILGAAFGGVQTADPTRYPLRVRLLTDREDDGLCALPWATIAYRGRRLTDDGWTVELHQDSHPGFPEYPPHTCYFPGKVVLIGASAGRQTPQGRAHLGDVRNFFQRRWQQAPEPILVGTDSELRAALRTGSTRLVYYYGEASSDGLLLEGAERSFTWSALAELLQQSRSVSAVFLNLLGDTSYSAIPQGRVLLNGAMAVLLQCNERMAAPAAAKAALDWLHSVFAASERLDPVVALHQHQHGQVTAWTRYASWQTVAPVRVEMPGLVNLLLDRRSQKAEVLQAKEDFYTFKNRRIYHAVAFGAEACRVTEFPAMASQHLRHHKRKREVFLHRSLEVPVKLDTPGRVDDLVRRDLGMSPRQSVVGALLGQETMPGTDFWFPVLGWKVQQPLDDVEAGVGLIRTIAEWCRTRLLQEMRESTHQTNLRVISVVAIETASSDVADLLKASISDLTKDLNREQSFHLGKLDPLPGVQHQDLSDYFHNPELCSCDDRYRSEFPPLLLGGREEMPFDEAVSAIQRGEPDNWGTLFEKLRVLTASGDWPPERYTPNFLEACDGR